MAIIQRTMLSIPPPGVTWMITLECLGDVPGSRFLDGRTQDGSVGLAGTTDPPFTGTRWAAMGLAHGGIMLKGLGDVPGSRFLDGRPQDGSVGLAASTGPPFSGTRWEATEVGPFGESPIT